MRIAGQRTDADWRECRKSLVVGGDPVPWKLAFDEFLMERLRTRYLDPIQAIQSLETKQGEGFSIVAIQCSLIEFLGATLEGKTYRFVRRGDRKLTEFEYSVSKDMFVSFLTGYVPFKTVFVDDARALNFYEGVRCGLLHEARTNKTWTIRSRAEHGEFIDYDQRIVWRDDLQRAFDEFFEWFGSTLPKDKTFQAAFIRKFDSLCEG